MLGGPEPREMKGLGGPRQIQQHTRQYMVDSSIVKTQLG